MDQPDDERAQDLVGAELPERPVEPRLRRRLLGVAVRLGRVTVDVAVDVVTVNVRVGVVIPAAAGVGHPRAQPPGSAG